MQPFFEMWSREKPSVSICRKANHRLWTLLFLLLATGRCGADETNAPPAASDVVITNMAQYWKIATDPEVRNQLHRLQLDLLVYYCNTNWGVNWGESDGLGGFLPLKNLPRLCRFGDKLRLDGLTLPVNQEILWDQTTLKVLSESNTVAALPTAGKLLNADELQGHFVEMEALVDSLESLLPGVLKLNLVAEDTEVDAYIPADLSQNRTSLVGKIVRIRGVYAQNTDPFGKISSLNLWTPDMGQITVLSSLADDPRFRIPMVTSDDFTASNSPPLVRVRGTVHSQELGESVTIWDPAGQIRILTKHRQPLRLGDQIEAIGYPTIQGLDRVLLKGVFRPDTGNTSTGDLAFHTNTTLLRLAGQVRELDQESLARQPAVSLQGLVTYVNSGANFTIVQDSSGGIRVMQSRFPAGNHTHPGMLVTVNGVAATGSFAPIITNAILRQTGTIPMPVPPIIGFEQAMSGAEDCRWVQMRGYVRQAIKSPRVLELLLVAAAGEFVAWVPPEDAPQAPEGSIVLVRGDCMTIANPRRQLTGFEIRSVTPNSVQTEQFAPADPFAETKRSLASLRQFNLFSTPNQRVRTEGTITLQVPGRYLCLQDGDDTLMALSDQTERLHPGDRVEIVGFPGHAGGQFLLREAVFRRIARGPEPRPAEPASFQTINEDWDGLLMRAAGRLLEVVKKTDETRLVLQVNNHVLEGDILESVPSPETNPEFVQGKLALNAQMAITGVYRIQRDEAGKPLSFLLDLRSWDDVRVIKPPPWWTLRRLLFLLAGILPMLGLVLLWTWHTRRSNQKLQRTQIELRQARDKLEERVQARTRELNEEVEARKRALVRLSEAQQRLIVASRQAGMAEVATGILHNVGNILNSVNVSATVITDALPRLRIEKFIKAADLLAEHSPHLAEFLTQDPRGLALPGYLQQLAASMAESEQALKKEVESLNKQIDHVKAVVVWQQGNARRPGFFENLNPVELMTDALQINQAAFDRHGITVVRQFDPLPPLTMDRHKVMQILINLLSNAQQALSAANPQSKRVMLRVHLAAPKWVRFEVSDNGIGIPAENLERVFSLGFTTKPDGHGFGLHSGANSAKEMGGRLFATSEGPGCGTTFVLELPAAPETEPAASPATQ